MLVAVLPLNQIAMITLLSMCKDSSHWRMQGIPISGTTKYSLEEPPVTVKCPVVAVLMDGQSWIKPRFQEQECKYMNMYKKL